MTHADASLLRATATTSGVLREPGQMQKWRMPRRHSSSTTSVAHTDCHPPKADKGSQLACHCQCRARPARQEGKQEKGAGGKQSKAGQSRARAKASGKRGGRRKG
eukprot:1426557-Rhodomonas_salina.1